MPRTYADFDSWHMSLAPNLRVRAAFDYEIPPAREQAAAAIRSELAACEVITRVLRDDPETIQLFEYHSVIVGGFAMLFLSAEGQQALTNGEFDFGAPAARHLVSRAERPAAIYWWALWGRGWMRGGLRGIVDLLQQSRYCAADLFAVPFTADGLRFMTNLGFAPSAGCRPGLLQYVRQPHYTDHGV